MGHYLMQQSYVTLSLYLCAGACKMYTYVQCVYVYVGVQRCVRL